MSASEANVAYLRQKGIHIILERLARGLLTLTPDDPIEYMMQELAKARLFTWPQQQYTGSEMATKLEKILPFFIGVPVTTVRGQISASFPTNACLPAMTPALMGDLASCLTYSYNFTKADVLVGAAEHCTGALVHACSCHTGQAYSLSNWYPEGLCGDIRVPSANRAGNGQVFLNSVTKGHRVILIADALWSGKEQQDQATAIAAAGAVVVAFVVVAESTSAGGRAHLNRFFPEAEVHSLIKFTTSGPKTALDGPVPRLTGVSVKQPYLIYQCPPEQGVLELKKAVAENSFVGIPISETPAGYPYCKFVLTDFVPLMSPELVEDMADSIVATSNIKEADVLLSMSDRGGGPLAHACAVRLGRPYILADWHPVAGDSTSRRTFKTLGTTATITVNGLEPGKKAFVLGDMLSSGGAALTLCEIIRDLGCSIVGCAFVSEKVNLNGRKKLLNAIPEMQLTSLCRFVAEPADPTLRVAGLRYSEKFKDLKLQIGSVEDSSPEAPRGGGGLSAGRPKQSEPRASARPEVHAEEPPPKPILTPADITSSLVKIRKSFEDVTCFELDKRPYAAFTLNETIPPMEPDFMDTVANCLTYCVDFSIGNVIVSAAVHAIGALVHACAVRTGQPYSLSNWYPSGLDGDIMIKKHVGLTGTVGGVYLNSVGRGDKVVFVDDVLWEGSNVEEHAIPLKEKGIPIVSIIFVAEAVNLGGRAKLEKLLPGVPIFSLVKFTATPKTKVVLDNGYTPKIGATPVKKYELPASKLSYNEKVDRTLSSFVGVSIKQTPLGYPYCNFALTDFCPQLAPQLVEDMAECCVMIGNFDEADVIVSESDRGGGPLVHACATRSGLPYCLANWYDLSDGATANTSTTTEIGFAGSGTIYVHGLQPGLKVMVVDDMLSSGGTAEALIRCVTKAGCEVVGAVFAAEKVNLNGRKRLIDLFPSIKVFAVCKFIAEPAEFAGQGPPPISRTVAFQELSLPFGGIKPASLAAPRGGKSGEQTATAEPELEEPVPVRRR